LGQSILLQAVEDYVMLRDMGLIVDCMVDASRWRSKQFSPIGYSSPSAVMDLVAFMRGPDLDYLCDLLLLPSDRVRARIGMTKTLSKVLTTESLPGSRANVIVAMKRHANPEISVVDQDDEESITFAA